MVNVPLCKFGTLLKYVIVNLSNVSKQAIICGLWWYKKSFQSLCKRFFFSIVIFYL